MKKRTKYIVYLSLALSVFTGTALASIDSYLYASGVPSYPSPASFWIGIDGDAVDNTGLTHVKKASNGVLTMGAEAGFGRAVFNHGTTSVRADAINDIWVNFSSSANYQATASAGSVGAYVGYANKTYLVDAAGGATVLASQLMLRGAAVGSTGGLVVTSASGTWKNIGGTVSLLTSNTSTTLGATESGALYYTAGGGVDYVDAAGNVSNTTGPSGALGLSAVVGGGALINVGSGTYLWNDVDETLTAINSGTTMDAVVGFGDDALYQLAGSAYYYDSSTGSSTVIAGATLNGGVRAGDFAMAELEYAGDANTYFYKDTGAGTFHSWQYSSSPGVNYAGAVGGYAAIPEPATLGLVGLLGGGLLFIRKRFMV